MNVNVKGTRFPICRVRPFKKTKAGQPIVLSLIESSRQTSNLSITRQHKNFSFANNWNSTIIRWTKLTGVRKERKKESRKRWPQWAAEFLASLHIEIKVGNINVNRLPPLPHPFVTPLGGEVATFFPEWTVGPDFNYITTYDPKLENYGSYTGMVGLCSFLESYFDISMLILLINWN